MTCRTQSCTHPAFPVAQQSTQSKSGPCVLFAEEAPKAPAILGEGDASLSDGPSALASLDSQFSLDTQSNIFLKLAKSLPHGLPW